MEKKKIAICTKNRKISYKEKKQRKMERGKKYRIALE